MGVAQAAESGTTVLVLNYNGRDHLTTCLSSLATALRANEVAHKPRAEDPDRCEVWLVDNGSADDSLALVQDRFPWVTIHALPENLGFSRALDHAAAACPSEWVVFLNNDTRVAPDWLAQLHQARARHPEARAIASTILSWDGSHIDFIGADTFFTGHAWQRRLGEAATSRDFPERQLLFGCAGALLVHRPTFLDLGGFDPDYFSFFEDVDYGWRATLCGQPTWFAPDAVVYHKLHATWDRGGHARIRYLTERNALCTLYKDLGEDRAGVQLLVAASLVVLRALALSENLRLVGKSALSTDALAHLLALRGFVELEPAMRARRKQLQARRALDDAAILPLFGAFASPPNVLGEEYRADLAAACRCLDIVEEHSIGAWPAALNQAAHAQALALCRLASRLAPLSEPDEVWLARGHEPTWEHVVPELVASSLVRCSMALRGFLANPPSVDGLRILGSELAAIADKLDQARERARSVVGATSTNTAQPTGGTASTPVLAVSSDELPARTVVVRTRNRLAALREALASVATQTLPASEVLVVNDGGEDPSAIAKELPPSLPLILVNLPGVGRSRAAQEGLLRARGPLVNFLDDDDTLKPEHLAALTAALMRHGAAVATSEVECLTWERDGAGSWQIAHRSVLGGELDLSRLHFESTIPIMAALMDRDAALAVGGFDASLDYFEDWDLWLRLAHRVRFVHHPAVTATYNIRLQAGQGAGLAGAHRWPQLAAFFDRHRDTMRGTDWARFYQRYLEPAREQYSTLRAELEALRQHVHNVESSKAWRLHLWFQRLLGRQ
jgi:GT2 family glycosyltransferase